MSNIDKIKQTLLEFEGNAILITDQMSRLYATGFSSSAGVLLVSETDAWFFIDSRILKSRKPQ